MVKLSAVLLAGSLVGSSIAHPGHDVAAEALERREFFASQPRGLAACANKLKKRGVVDRGIARRAALAQDLRAKRGIAPGPFLMPRDPNDVNESHKSNLTVTLDTDPNVLFADNSSCVLQPETTEGPYYVSGELIRENVTDGEEGIDQAVYVQLIDTATCNVVPNVYIDFWHCNSTGVYSGIVANTNGDISDASNINNTAFRGIQSTDDEGVAIFHTKAAGHYTGRTTHIHIMTHVPSDASELANKTLGTNSLLATHVGQFFFDQDLINSIETFPPYNTNTQVLTLNSEDGILAAEASTEHDPFLEWALLGDSLEDGFLSWITVGIDASAAGREVNNAAYIGEDGGVATGKGGGGPPGGGRPPTD